MSGTNATYLLPIVHSDQEELAREIGDAVRDAAAEVVGGTAQVDVIAGVPDVAPPSTHVVLIYAGSRAGARDSNVDAEIEKALRSGHAVLPVVRTSEPDSVKDMLPARIEHLHAVDWDRDRSLAQGTILRQLGLVEDERRLFLSYARRDSTDIAEQLHRQLQERQFDVFLDRFTMPPGANFQDRLREDLADRAFLLLLESDGIRDSEWVQHEINYALSHRIGTLAVTMPNLATGREAPIDEAFRYRLSAEDLQDGELTSTALGSGRIGDFAASLVHDVEHMDEDHAGLLQWVGAPRGLAVRRILESGLQATA